MASAIEDWSGRRLRPSANGWTAERLFSVPYATSETEALAASGLPLINSSHPQNALLKVDSLEAATPEGPQFWQVRASYSIPVGGGDHVTDSDPLNQPQEIEWIQNVSSEQIDRDIRSNPIVNSARIPFDQRPTRDVFTWSVTITRNEPFFDWNTARQFQNTVNSETVTIGTQDFEPGTIRCAKIIPAGKFTANASYVPITYTFEFRDYPPNLPGGVNGFGTKTWEKSPFQLWIVDQSFSSYYDDGGTLKRGNFVDGELQDVTSPILLAGNGTPIQTQFKLTGAQKTAANQNALPGVFTFRAEISGTTTGYVLVYLQCEGADFNDLGI